MVQHPAPVREAHAGEHKVKKNDFFSSFFYFQTVYYHYIQYKEYEHVRDMYKTAKSIFYYIKNSIIVPLDAHLARQMLKMYVIAGIFHTDHTIVETNNCRRLWDKYK